MPINSDMIKKLSDLWAKTIDHEQEELKTVLSEVELGALYSWTIDCFQGFDEISDLIKKAHVAGQTNNSEEVHDSVVDIYWQLDHIKNHILDAEAGFSLLMQQLASKAKAKEKESTPSSSSP